MPTNPLTDEQIDALCERLEVAAGRLEAAFGAEFVGALHLREAAATIRSLREPYEAGRLEGMREAAEIAEKYQEIGFPKDPAIAAAIRNRIEESRDGQCDLCVDTCRGHRMGHPEEWEPEPGSRAALATPEDGDGE